MPSTKRWGRRASVLAAAGCAVFLALVAPDWLSAWTSTWHAGTVASAVLRAALYAYGIGLVTGVLGTAVLAVRLVRRRGRGPTRPFEVRLLLLSASLLLALGAAEGMARAYERWGSRPHSGAPQGDLQEPPGYPEHFPPNPPGSLRILVLGGSSAYGVPFGPRLSVGNLVAWKLGEALPGKTAEAQILATGGATLEHMHELLKGIRRRPDVLLVFSGNNEFQGRFPWSRTVDYYADDVLPKPGPTLGERIAGCSAVGRAILRGIEARAVSIPPPRRITRQLIDRPCFTRAEWDDLLRLFRRRLEGMVEYAERIGAVPVLIIPPGNDAGFEPSRSMLDPSTPPAERARFARDFLAVRELEANDPERAIAAYRSLLGRQPGFAESHFRLGQLLQRRGDIAGAREAYDRARDLDGFPLRVSSSFQAIYRDVAARHPGAILIDGPALLESISRTGLRDDVLFHDAHHPTLIGHAALAQAVLDGLHDRGALGWPPGVPSPRVDPARCAEHAKLDADDWADVFEGTAKFFDRTAYLRHDPTERLAKRELYQRAADRVRAGESPGSVGIPGVPVP